MTEALITFLNGLGYLFVAYSLAINTSFAVLTVLAIYSYNAYHRRTEFAGYDENFGEPMARGVSVLMPAHNEAATIAESVRAMLSLRYPDFEVIVVDDGSRDDTVRVVIEAFDMVEAPLVVGRTVDAIGTVRRTWVSRSGGTNLVLVSKDNGGKADALNVGINVARKELVCMVDADSLLDPDALLHVARPFADHPERVVASGGVVRVANGGRVAHGRVLETKMPRSWLPRIQVVEYLRAFMIGRAGWSALGGLLIISGAFGMFRRDMLYAVNGVAVDCIGEDAELVVRLYRWLGDRDIDGRVVFVGEPVAWTEVPETRRVLRNQRRRWHRGLTEVFARHRHMMLRPRYGVIGMVTLPWFWLFELAAPFVEVFGLGYFALVLAVLALEQLGAFGGADLVDPGIVVLLLSTSVVYAIMMSLLALVGEEVSFARYTGVRNMLLAIWATVEENVGYRQMTAVWRLRGTWDALRRRRHVWGDMQRRGFAPDPGREQPPIASG